MLFRSLVPESGATYSLSLPLYHGALHRSLHPPPLLSSPLLSPQPSSRPTSLSSPHSRLSVPHPENLQRRTERDEGEAERESNGNVKPAPETPNKVVTQTHQLENSVCVGGNTACDSRRRFYHDYYKERHTST